jgi:hypothetical protein
LGGDDVSADSTPAPFVEGEREDRNRVVTVSPETFAELRRMIESEPDPEDVAKLRAFLDKSVHRAAPDPAPAPLIAATGEYAPDFLRRAARAFGQLGGGPMQDCLNDLAQQLEARTAPDPAPVPAEREMRDTIRGCIVKNALAAYTRGSESWIDGVDVERAAGDILAALRQPVQRTPASGDDALIAEALADAKDAETAAIEGDSIGAIETLQGHVRGLTGVLAERSAENARLREQVARVEALCDAAEAPAKSEAQTIARLMREEEERVRAERDGGNAWAVVDPTDFVATRTVEPIAVEAVRAALRKPAAELQG